MGLFDRLTRRAEQHDNGAKGGGAIKPCEWRLRVKVVSTEPIWPKATVTITATRSAGAVGAALASQDATLKAKDGKPVELTRASGGDATYTLRAATTEEGWTEHAVGLSSGNLTCPNDVLVELRIKNPLQVFLKLTYKDPKGAQKVFPPDFPVTVVYDDKTTQAEKVADDGKLTFEVPRTKKSFTLHFYRDQNLPFIASAPAGYGGAKPERMAGKSDLAQLRTDKFRFFTPPLVWRLRESVWTITGTGIVADDWKFQLGKGNDQVRRVGADGARVGMVLDPNWQFLRFEYFDRYYGHENTHNNRRVNIPPVLVDGFLAAPTPAQLDPVPDVSCEWVEDDGDIVNARHCLPWILQKTEKGKAAPQPTEKFGLAVRTKAGTYVVSDSDTVRKIEEIAANHARLKPSADRLKIYDLPQHWRSTNYYVRFADDTGVVFNVDEKSGDKAAKAAAKAAAKELKTRLPASKTIGTPLIFCLDDIVVTSDKLKPLALAKDARVCVFHHQFKDPAAGATDPVSKCGMHDPGTDVDVKGFPYSLTTVGANAYLTDYPNWTRLVVAGGNLHDAFGHRTAAADDSPVFGARAAVRWKDSAALAKAGDALSPRPDILVKDYFSTQPFYEQAYLSRSFPPGAGAAEYTEWDAAADPAGFNNGRFDTAHLRCCGYEGAKEVAVVFRYHRFAFDLDAQVNDLQGADEATQKDWIKKVVIDVANRWNGDDDKNADRTWVDPRGAAPALRNTVITFLQYLDADHSHFLIETIPETGTSSMTASTGAGKLRPKAAEETAGRGMAAAHETGHTGGQPDEYSPSEDGQDAFGSNHMLGAPYNLDPEGMMRGNRFVRAHSLWQVAEWMRKTPALSAVEWKVVHGAESYQLPHYAHDKPGRSWMHWPVRVNTRARGSGTGCFDSHLYLLGADQYSTAVLPGLLAGGTFDAILTVLVRIYFRYPDSLNEDAFREALYAEVNPMVHNTLNEKRAASLTVSTPGPPAIARSFVHFSERYLSGKKSTASAAQKETVTDKLADAPYHLRVTITERTAQEQTNMDAAKATANAPALQTIDDTYNVMPQPLSQAQANQQAADRQALLDAAKLPDAPGATHANAGAPWEQTVDMPADYATLSDDKKSKERTRVAIAVARAVIRALGLSTAGPGSANSYQDAASYVSIVRSVMAAGGTDPVVT